MSSVLASTYECRHCAVEFSWAEVEVHEDNCRENSLNKCTFCGAKFEGNLDVPARRKRLKHELQCPKHPRNLDRDTLEAAARRHGDLRNREVQSHRGGDRPDKEEAPPRSSRRKNLKVLAGGADSRHSAQRVKATDEKARRGAVPAWGGSHSFPESRSLSKRGDGRETSPTAHNFSPANGDSRLSPASPKGGGDATGRSRGPSIVSSGWQLDERLYATKYRCAHCGASFLGAVLKLHEVNCAENPSNRCQHCHKKFGGDEENENEYGIQRRARHEDVCKMNPDNFAKCSHCSKEFTSTPEVSAGTRVAQHENICDANPLTKCDFCGKALKAGGSLRLEQLRATHSRICKDNPENYVQCPFCRKLYNNTLSFSASEQLRSHLVACPDNPAHKCCHCGEVFKGSAIANAADRRAAHEQSCGHGPATTAHGGHYYAHLYRWPYGRRRTSRNRVPSERVPLSDDDDYPSTGGGDDTSSSSSERGSTSSSSSENSSPRSRRYRRRRRRSGGTDDRRYFYGQDPTRVPPEWYRRAHTAGGIPGMHAASDMQDPRHMWREREVQQEFPFLYRHTYWQRYVDSVNQFSEDISGEAPPIFDFFIPSRPAPPPTTPVPPTAAPHSQPYIPPNTNSAPCSPSPEAPRTASAVGSEMLALTDGVSEENWVKRRVNAEVEAIRARLRTFGQSAERLRSELRRLQRMWHPDKNLGSGEREVVASHVFQFVQKLWDEHFASRLA